MMPLDRLSPENVARADKQEIVALLGPGC